MEEQTDSAFIKNMSIVVVILVVFTVSIVFLARDIGFKDAEGDNPNRQAIVEQRIQPVADVYTAENGPPAIEEAAVESAAVVAFEGSLDAEMLYGSVCAVCHATGAAGAPQPGSDAMAQRAEKGMDAMMQTALNGLNAMPARGGRADLSDEQMQVIVEFMTQ